MASSEKCQGSPVSRDGCSSLLRMEEDFSLVLRVVPDLQLSHPEMAQRCLAGVVVAVKL